MSKSEVLTENKMGTMPVGKLIINMSVPMMVSNLVQALYNIVDSIFVSRIDENALTAVSMAFPIQSLLIAFGMGTGVGVNAMLSKALGEGDRKKAGNAAKNGIFMSVICYIIFLIVGLTLVGPYYMSQTNDSQIIEYGKQYLSWVCCLSFGIYMQFIFERLLQSTGKTMYSMITQITGAVINCILDPILIFGLFGMPKLGVQGAAVATVFGQITAATMALIINLSKNKEIDLSFKGFKPQLNIIGRIYAVGFPSIVMMAVGSLMNYGINRILIGFTSTAVAVFGVYYKLQSFVFMPVFGLNNGMVPIVAFNYGAQNRKRMIKTIKLSILFAIAVMSVGTILFQIFPKPMFELFDASEHMLEIGIPALRIISVHFPVAAFCIIGGSVFQALGNGVYSLIVSICRQLVVLLPAVYLLSLLGTLTYVWWAFPIAEVVSLLTTVFFLARINKKIISKIPDGKDV